MNYERTIEIRAPAEEVWAVLADVQRWPQWTPTMTEVRPQGTGPLAVGSAVRVRQPRLPPVTWTVSRFEAGRSFSWTARGPGSSTVADHDIRPGSGATCTVTLRYAQSGPVGTLISVILARLIRRYVNLEAESLRRRCEHSPGAH